MGPKLTRGTLIGPTEVTDAPADQPPRRVNSVLTSGGSIWAVKWVYFLKLQRCVAHRLLVGSVYPRTGQLANTCQNTRAGKSISVRNRFRPETSHTAMIWGSYVEPVR